MRSSAIIAPPLPAPSAATVAVPTAIATTACRRPRAERGQQAVRTAGKKKSCVQAWGPQLPPDAAVRNWSAPRSAQEH